MKLKAIAGIMLALLFASVSTVAFSFAPMIMSVPAVILSSQPVHNIDTGLNYSTIQAAIDASETLGGHTILVDAGIYYENVVVSKSLTLVGENMNTTIVDGNGTGQVVRITVNNVNISRFTMRNSGPWPGAGIYVAYSANSVISNCNCSFNGGRGICAEGADHLTVRNNIVSNNGLLDKGAEGIRIMWYSRNCLLINNTVLNNTGVGIALYTHWYTDGGRHTLRDNRMNANEGGGLAISGPWLSNFMHDIDTSNTVDGKPVYYLINQRNLVIEPSTYPKVGFLGLVNCSGITVKGLTVTGSGQGVLFAYTTNSTIMNIKALNNGGGISLWYSSGNKIISNILANNVYYGIDLVDSTGNTVTANTIVNNEGAGIYFYKFEYGNPVTPSNNLVYWNNFIENTVQIAYIDTPVSSNTWDDGGIYLCPICGDPRPKGNYWSDYTGLDDGTPTQSHNCPGDGVGDTNTPHLEVDKYPLMAPWIPIPGDLNYDGIVDDYDLFLLARNYGKTN